MGRNVTLDFSAGGGSDTEFLIGTITLEPTAVHEIGNRVVLPAPRSTGINAGVGVLEDVAISPAGPEPAWAYRATVRDSISGKAQTWLVGVPTGTSAIPFKQLTKFTTTIPPQTTAGMMQNWADTAQDGATRAEDAADRAEAPTDLMNKNLIENPASLTAGALSTAIVDETVDRYSPLRNTAYMTYGVLSKLKTGGEDVKLVNLSDSTGSSGDGYFAQLSAWLQSQYPGYGYKYIDWNHTTEVFEPAEIRQPTTNGFYIVAYNAGREGMNTDYPIGYLDVMVQDIQPDVAFINFGHNMGAGHANMEGAFSRLICSVQSLAPNALIMMCTQNPRMDGINTQEVNHRKASIMRNIANSLGIGLLDFYEAFIATGDVLAYTRPDLLHPNELGQTLMTKVCIEAFTWRVGGQSLAAQTPPLLTVGRDLLTNGALKWEVDPAYAPDGWNVSGGPAVKETNPLYIEHSRGYSIKLEANGTAQVYLSQSIPGQRVKGQWVTLAARFYVPAGAHMNAGKIQVGSITSLGAPFLSAKGGWKWEVVTAYVATTATSLVVRAYASTSTASTGPVWLDRIILCPGLLPRDTN